MNNGQNNYNSTYPQNYQDNYQSNYSQGCQRNYQQDYQQGYQQNYYQPNYPQQPMRQLKTNRSMWKYLLLGLVTFGIYDIVCLYTLTEDINIIASRYDGKKTMNFLLMNLLSESYNMYG